MKIYRSELDKLTQRAKKQNPNADGLCLGEKFFVELLNHYINQYRVKIITEDDLKAKKKNLEKDLINYWDSQELFKRACEIRIAQSEWLVKAEKQGCEICKKLVRIFDGREVNFKN